MYILGFQKHISCQLLDQLNEYVPDKKNTGIIKGAIRITQKTKT